MHIEIDSAIKVASTSELHGGSVLLHYAAGIQLGLHWPAEGTG
jgi:hypothetical protein